MAVEALIREFRHSSLILQDIPGMTPEEVKTLYAAAYPELTNAVVEGPEISGNKMVYTFRKAVGAKGTGESPNPLRTTVKTDENGLAYLAVVPANVKTPAEKFREFLDWLGPQLDRWLFWSPKGN